MKNIVRCSALYLILGLGLCFTQKAFAAKNIQQIAENISPQLTAIAVLLVIAAYVAGVGFALMGVTQFKAHKDNPVQVPLSKPIVYLVISSCLLFLPTLMSSAGTTMFGKDKQVGKTNFSASVISD